MPDLSWREAIKKVLHDRGEPMHYTAIADAIAAQKLRTSLGATPASTVNAEITTSIKDEQDRSDFVRIERGRYWLRNRPIADSQIGVQQPTTSEPIDDTGLINAFGMYWSRDKVLWATIPKILGKQPNGSTVDFCGEKGVYLLYDGREVVYVGRATERPLGVRLREHTLDRLNVRWNRFSWFGVYKANESGSLVTDALGSYDQTMLIVTMEALLIEGLEPRQNKKGGDDFRAVEFLQVEDPNIQTTQAINLLKELQKQGVRP